MKVLISAYSCEPGQGSEPGVGWNVVQEIAKYHQVWVLTRPDESKDIIEAELARNPVPSLHFVYFTLPFWQDSRRWGHSGGMQLHYYLWQIQAYFVARQLHRKIGFDLTHHITFVRHSSPSFLALLPVPFVWGPVGGGESAPKAYWQDFNLNNRLYEILRSVWRWIGEQDPFTRLTACRSAIAFATTSDTAQRICTIGAPQVKILSQCNLSEREILQLVQLPSPHTQPVRFISIARLLHWKGLHLALRAFAEAKLSHAEYWILGEGSEWKRLQTLSEDLGIKHQLKFLGHLPREEALVKLGSSSALVHPSLHDSGGLVCLEAMAAGRPVICLDLGGPAVQVTSETGFVVPADNPKQSVSGIARAMIQLAEDVDLRVKMGQAGQQRVRELFSWDAQGKLFTQIYQDLNSSHRMAINI
ncbi:glycosyltransferase [Gloeocapsopsis crepidinum LEGE 06123]|uniref:Glycosyltransferase n=1 Tax=Gloeocapsopsis crepidinum LEGE 06123 TaxID=588587 RepID=A0ABR9USU2_9CHRO|nr:glycosyltransferase [Gloeocapsopsis crepidinum]MBE9191344.1 glycosyltransferase [Gloeocapsopsis crepidinum LEGE 06123]